jgi:ribosome-associated heat shock protein Hsp15
MRIDRLLVYLRLARTRSRAQALVEAGHLRLNGKRLQRASATAGVGDILTLPWGSAVRIIQILQVPDRRGTPAFAGSCYRELDRDGETAIAASHSDD